MPDQPADRYTHGHHDSVLDSHRTRSAADSAAYLLPHLRAGQRLLDVGRPSPAPIAPSLTPAGACSRGPRQRASRTWSRPSVWVFADPERRGWWSETWAQRVVSSGLATQAVELGLATPDELADIAAGWRAWAVQPDAWSCVVSGEILAAP